MSAVPAVKKFSYLFLRLIEMDTPKVLLHWMLATRITRVWREGRCHLICRESTKATCDAPISCIGMFATTQRNGSPVASLMETRYRTIYNITARSTREVNLVKE